MKQATIIHVLIPVKVARRAKSLTMSRRKKLLNFVYIEEKYLTPGEETEGQSTRK
jgi:hypothetical protein